MTSPKTETTTRYATLRTVRETRESLERRAKEYKTALVNKNMDRGRDLLTDFRKKPYDTLDGILADSRDFVRNLSEKSGKTFENVKEETRAWVRKSAGHPFKTLGNAAGSLRRDADQALEKLASARKKAAKDLERDFRLAISDIKDLRKKGMDRLPTKTGLTNAVKNRIASLPGVLNLPSRTEIDDLIQGIEGIEKKIDGLRTNRIPA